MTRERNTHSARSNLERELKGGKSLHVALHDVRNLHLEKRAYEANGERYSRGNACSIAATDAKLSMYILGGYRHLVMNMRGQRRNCDTGVTNAWYGFPERDKEVNDVNNSSESNLS